MAALVRVPLAFALCIFALCCANGFCSILPVTDSEAATAAVSSSNSTLELVHVILRHGPRTPVNTYPKDPYVNEEFYPFGWGHLTNEAKRELFKIGKYLRKRYRNLLVPYYYNDLLHAQSTASPRTIMSLQMVLASLFPPKKTPMDWNERYNWQPVPVYSDPQDIMLRMTTTCPRYDEALQEVFQLPEVQAELAQNETMFQELSELTGLNVTSAQDVNSIYITLLAELAYGLEVPAWTQGYFPEKMEFMAAQTYVYNAYTTEMQKIKGGPFLQKMFSEMTAKAANNLKPQGRKMFLYCAHDWSIANILSALGVWQRQMPRFSALIAIELHKTQETGEYHVEIYFKNNPSEEAVPLTVPGCDFKCPLQKLIELRSAVIPSGSFEEMCRAKASQM